MRTYRRCPFRWTHTTMLIFSGAALVGCAAPGAIRSIDPGGPGTAARSGPDDAAASTAARQDSTPPAKAVARDTTAAARPARSNPAADIDWHSARDAAAAGSPPGPRAPGKTTKVAAGPNAAGTEANGFSPGPLFRVSDPAPAVDALPAVTAGESSSQRAAEALRTDRVSELLVELSSELYQQSAYDQTALPKLLAIAAQSIVRPQRSLDVAGIADLSEQEREILVQFQIFCARLGTELEGTADSEAVVAQAVTDLRNALIESPRLTIATTALCYHVGGFGDYQAFDRRAFLAHEEQQVILYLEIDDFSSTLNGQGQWVTELSQQLVLYSDRDGIPVWTAPWQPAVDVSRKQRHDFFTVQVITLPKALSVGKYQLKIHVRDEHSEAETETSIEVEMVADPKLATAMPG